MTHEAPGVERMDAWQCIGCGRLEATRPCVGICSDARVELVYAFEHDRAAARAEVLEAIVRRLAFTTPRGEDWQRTWKALQGEARRVLALGDAGGTAQRE